MRIRLLLILGLVGLLGLPTMLALADNGPHGGYTATTDQCAGCHRVHTANVANLLHDTTPNLCYTCHGSMGAGADTNVVDGVYLERDSQTEAPAEGIHNRGLKGGGFTNAMIDTDWDMSAGSAAVTSSHLVDGSTGTAWGNGELGSGAGAAGFNLSCTACHDPHGGASTTGGATYRLLRAVPTGSGAGSGINVTEESPKYYVVSNSDNQYFGENYGSRALQLDDWCSQCHTRYAASAGSGHTDSGDPVFGFRHRTDGVIRGCMSCHVAHGTSANMGVNSGSVVWPDGAMTPSGNNRSSLLRVDNRGVCQLCHLK